MIRCDKELGAWELISNLPNENFLFPTYNLGHNILKLYNVLIQTRITTSKTKRDM